MEQKTYEHSQPTAPPDYTSNGGAPVHVADATAPHPDHERGFAGQHPPQQYPQQGYPPQGAHQPAYNTQYPTQGAPQAAYNTQYPAQSAPQDGGTVLPIAALTGSSAPVMCPHCHKRTMTATSYITGNTTHVWALGLFCFTLCLCCIPYMIDGTKDVEHRCSHCGTLLAHWHRSGRTEQKAFN